MSSPTLDSFSQVHFLNPHLIAVFMTPFQILLFGMTQLKQLKRLHDEIKCCTKCSLHRTRNNAVPGEGPVDARVMFVGEAPGAKEDELGRPFVGRSGNLLTEMLEGIGLTRNAVFITSVLKSRPPNNRKPKREEVDTCMPYLIQQFEIINPEYIVLLGGIAVSSIIGPWKLSEAHGRFYEANGKTFFITYHPAAALRFPKIKEKMSEDFRILQQELHL
jgi:uracil-DNA glycosylase family 4